MNINCYYFLQRIQEGNYDLPDEDSVHISEPAKDLLQHLLVRDPHERYTAAEVLEHQWGVSIDDRLAAAKTLFKAQRAEQRRRKRLAAVADALRPARQTRVVEPKALDRLTQINRPQIVLIIH